MSVDISVIIVNWNTKALLIQCLESILKNKGPYSLEVIVVDNGSIDGSCDAIRREFEHVLLIENKENLGFARANNIGIEKSKGRYICLINSDVVIKEDCIERLFEFMEINRSIGICAPRIVGKDNRLQISCRNFPTLWNNLCSAFGLNRIFPRSRFFSGEQMRYFLHDRIQNVDALAGCFLMVRRDAMKYVGPLDEQFFIYGEDIDWCRRFWDQGWPVVFYPLAEAIHFGGESSKKAPIRFFLEQEKTILQYWKKHHGPLALRMIKAILFIHHIIRLSLGIPVHILKGFGEKDQEGRIERHIKGMKLLLTWP